jgi:hypothetical protein
MHRLYVVWGLGTRALRWSGKGDRLMRMTSSLKGGGVVRMKRRSKSPRNGPIPVVEEDAASLKGRDGRVVWWWMEE